jgi:hypothetical protein
MGVRAIEQETKPLGAHAESLAATLAQTAPAEVARQRIQEVLVVLDRERRRNHA